MSIQYSETSSPVVDLSAGARWVLLACAVLAAVGPNGLYLYALFFRPDLNQQALSNPVALAFMIEAMLLLGLFLWYVRRRTGSWAQVAMYLGLAFLGSLAFSLPLFLYNDSRRQDRHDGD